MAVIAIMSVVAYGGLRAVLSADQVTQEHARRLADLQVTLSGLERDLAAKIVDIIQCANEFGDRMPPRVCALGGQQIAGG